MFSSSLDDLQHWMYCGLMTTMYGPLQATMPRGDGHPVLVLPGFCMGPHQTLILRSVLRLQGYDARDWGQGINTGSSPAVNEALQALLVELAQRERVTLVGWSLGGLYARALANTYPDQVRRVVTLGSPHRADPNASALRPIFEMLSPTPLSEVTEADRALVRNDPPVPVTAIYTRTDECVEWKDCLVDESPLAENVEVHGTHMGLTHNVKAIQVVLDRLARQP